MPRQRTEQLIYELQKLMKLYPEYAEILQQLIEQIKQGKAARIQTALEQLSNGGW